MGMSSVYELVEKHLNAAVADAASGATPPAEVASAMIETAVRLLQKSRSNEDIASELQFVIENLEEHDHHFIRP
jgi:hypothetical protein